MGFYLARYLAYVYLALQTTVVTAQHANIGASECGVVSQIDGKVVGGTERSNGNQCQVLRTLVMDAILSSHHLTHHRTTVGEFAKFAGEILRYSFIRLLNQSTRNHKIIKP